MLLLKLRVAHSQCHDLLINTTKPGPTLQQSSDTIAALYHFAAQMMATHSLGFRSSSPASRISTCKVQLTMVEEEKANHGAKQAR
jgi:hypothetical protein